MLIFFLLLTLTLSSCTTTRYVPYYEPNVTIRDSVSGYKADDGTLVEEHWHTETHVIEVDKPIPRFYRNSTIVLYTMIALILIVTITAILIRIRLL